MFALAGNTRKSGAHRKNAESRSEASRHTVLIPVMRTRISLGCESTSEVLEYTAASESRITAPGVTRGDSPVSSFTAGLRTLPPPPFGPGFLQLHPPRRSLAVCGHPGRSFTVCPQLVVAHAGDTLSDGVQFHVFAGEAIHASPPGVQRIRSN